MNVFPRFVGDDDDALMKTQHAGYGRAVVRIFGAARWQYRLAEKVVGVPTSLGAAAESVERFDHRTLQGCHDLLAAAFRKSVKKRPPAREGLFRQEDLWGAWFEWLRRTLDELFAEPEYVRLVLTAVVEANNDRGLAAERFLARELCARFGLEEDAPEREGNPAA